MGCDRSKSSPLGFRPIKWSIWGKEYIHLDHACHMYQVKRTPVLDGFLDIGRLHVLCALQPSNEMLHVVRVYFSDHIHIERGSRYAMRNTGDGSANIVGHTERIEGVCQWG